MALAAGVFDAAILVIRGALKLGKKALMKALGDFGDSLKGHCGALIDPIKKKFDEFVKWVDEHIADSSPQPALAGAGGPGIVARNADEGAGAVGGAGKNVDGGANVDGGGTLVRRTSGNTTIYSKKGGMKQADADFDKMGLSDVREIDGVGRMGTDANGNRVIVREKSRDGRPTIELQKPNSKGDFGKFEETRYDD